MANTIDFILTTAASDLMSKTLGGKTLNFTRMAVGDGFSYDTTTAKGYKTLVNEVLSLDITKKETLSASSVRITSAFKNTDTQKEFYYREVGLYAQDPDTGEEVLYAYGNRNDAAELITPTGSSVVTKQLIFIITVGDSANVTFNVNADVYALQSDMLKVQANKADKNLANTGMITNCLLEVPQNIKLELSDGRLTLKAGSIVIVPRGNGEFEHITIDKDKTTVWQYNGKGIVFFGYNNSYLYHIPVTNISSGTTAPTVTDKNWAWFDTTNQLLKITSDNGVTWYSDYTLPLGVVTSTKADGLTSIDQVFNGVGYIGSTVWVDKGVKGLIPNGRNPDGTLNNIEHIVSSIILRDFNEEAYTGAANYVIGHLNSIENSGSGYYVSDENYLIDNFNKSKTMAFEFAKGIRTNGSITSFISYQPFNIVNNSSDKPWLSSLSMPSEKYIELELGEKGATYIAPANGWFAIRKVAAVINDIFTLAVWDSTSTIEIHRTSIISPLSGAEIAFSVPISKGQTLAVDYKEAGEIKYFRFIYAQGEIN